MSETYEVEGKTVHIFSIGEGIPYIYLGVQENSVEYVERIAAFLTENVENPSMTLVAYEAKDWNAEFSPWSAPSIWKKTKDDPGFIGKGPDTLQWLKEIGIPFVEKTENPETGRRNRYLAGYSLAGLFSLWAFYESQIFRGCVSGSGSLWFPGWMEYLEKASAPEDSCIYLSLGGKEEKTKNPVMASIGNATRKAKAQIEADENVTFSCLEWNPGGHFSDPDIRVAKGVAWILNKHIQDKINRKNPL